MATCKIFKLLKRTYLMNKQEIYDFLKSKNIGYEITEHKAVYNMQDLNDIDLPYKDVDSKKFYNRIVKYVKKMPKI